MTDKMTAEQALEILADMAHMEAEEYAKAGGGGRVESLHATLRTHLTAPGYVRVPVEQVTEESVAEGAYWCATEIIEPYVQRLERPTGELPASLVESVQFLLDHWLATKETSHD